MKKILIVDDDEQIRFILKDLLKKTEAIINEAGDGDEAIKKFNIDRYDLIILDILMPGKEGIQTIQELKQANPGLKIIAISGGGHIGANVYLDMARKIGADLCISKPIDLNKFLGQVTDLLAD